MADTVLLINERANNFNKLLVKLGYSVVNFVPGDSFDQAIAGKLIDIIVLDAQPEAEDLIDRVELVRFVRSQPQTGSAPILVVDVKDVERGRFAGNIDASIELISGALSIGQLAGKIATTLRLHKQAGLEDPKASLAAANAALRDLNARHNKELEEARRIQFSLLPGELPVGELFGVACEYRPLEAVGGDWYFVEKLPSGAISLLIADVTGHGLAAAFIGCMTKLAMTAAVGDDPAKRLTEINHLMAPVLPEGRFVTLEAVVYHPDSGRLVVSSAGHPAVIVASGDSVVEVGKPEFAIGFVDDHSYSNSETVLPPNGVAVLYTDGLVEAQNRDNQLFGSDRLKQAVLTAAELANPDQAVKAVCATHAGFLDERIIKDDLTLIVLKRFK